MVDEMKIVEGFSYFNYLRIKNSLRVFIKDDLSETSAIYLDDIVLKKTPEMHYSLQLTIQYKKPNAKFEYGLIAKNDSIAKSI